MRAVKDGLPAPSGEVEESEGPRSTVAVGSTGVSFQETGPSELGPGMRLDDFGWVSVWVDWGNLEK